MQSLIIIRGYPGSGKTTIGKLLHDQGYGSFIDHNKLLAFVSAITGDDEGIYDDIQQLELAMCRKLLHDGKSVIVARGFSSASSTQPYLDLANEANLKRSIVRLEAPTAVLAKRVLAPERKLDFNPTVTSEALGRWVDGNVIEQIHGEHIIDATLNIEQVIQAILTITGPK